MPRGLRICQKKRGHRRTGSSKLAMAAEVAFFAVLLLVGAGVLSGLIQGLVLPEWRVNHEFVENTCTVLDKRIAVADRQENPSFRPEVKVRYDVNGESLTAWTYDIATVANGANSYSSKREETTAILDRFTRGEDYQCWYDPTNPEVVVLVRGYRWWFWTVLAVPLLFVLIGAGGLMYGLFRWNTSAERRAEITRRTGRRELLSGNGRNAREYPTVPEGSDITNSPGTTLRYRLPIATSPGWALFGTLLACIGWNGVVSAFVIMAINGYVAGDPDWVMTILLVPFVVAGVALMVALIRQLLLTTGVGPTQVELSDHPLRPGVEYEVFISQSGRLPLDSLDVQLRCEEQATYREGTNTRTESRGIFSEPIYRGEGLRVRRSMPFQAKCRLTVPDDAMHSFKSEHNSVTWRLVVEGRVAGWRNYRRDYPLIVFPAEQTNGHD
ncbi:MAG: DUF3592 domain-containing protein [Patescibacteria group bacterium]|nr:DUF3592 domain-containing protein [Patescibacteria group bacterium]